MAYATEAHLFITDLNQSPFNVGTRVALEDFTEGEVSVSIGSTNRHWVVRPRSHSSIVWFGGHPYLVRCGLHAMVEAGLDISRLENKADREDGVFGDHLRRMQGLLMQDVGLCDARASSS